MAPTIPLRECDRHAKRQHDAALESGVTAPPCEEAWQCRYGIRRDSADVRSGAAM